jgi:hypothetical protein
MHHCLWSAALCHLPARRQVEIKFGSPTALVQDSELIQTFCISAGDTPTMIVGTHKGISQMPVEVMLGLPAASPMRVSPPTHSTASPMKMKRGASGIHLLTVSVTVQRLFSCADCAAHFRARPARPPPAASAAPAS